MQHYERLRPEKSYITVICLRSSHKTSQCRSKSRYFKCNSKHHISICGIYGLHSRHGITQGPDNHIGNSSQNGNNNNSATLNMTDSVNVERVDNSKNSHTVLSLNKHGNVLLQTARGIIINKKNQNLKRNIGTLFDSGSQKSFINE